MPVIVDKLCDIYTVKFFAFIKKIEKFVNYASIKLKMKKLLSNDKTKYITQIKFFLKCGTEQCLQSAAVCKIKEENKHKFLSVPMCIKNF